MVNCQKTATHRYFKFYMPSTKAERTPDKVDFFANHFDMHKTSSEYAASISASQLINDLKNPTTTSPFKVEEPVLDAIKNYQNISNLQCNHKRLNDHIKEINF